MLATMLGNSGMMRIFQCACVVSTWKLELPKEINDIDYGALLDVRLTFYYKARYDPELHALVIQELASRPGINARQREIPTTVALSRRVFPLSEQESTMRYL